ncbi:cytochrome p450 [Hirsutella rhossiliensis]
MPTERLIIGPIVRIGPNEVDIIDIEAVKTIYGSRETFRKSQFYRRLAVPGQQSLFNTVNVDFHRRHRKLLAGPMSDSSLKWVIVHVEARLALALSRIGEEMKSRGAADVFKWWLFMTTDTIGELTFGDSFRMLELGHKNDYARDLEQDSRVGAIRATFPSMVGLCRVAPFPILGRAYRASENLTRYASDLLERHQWLQAVDPDEAQRTFFSKLFSASEDGKMPFNEIRDEAQNFITAGSDTTANSLTYLTWAVCRNPDIRARLVRELRTLPPDFTEAQLRSLPFLDQVISEALRLYSAAPSGLPRLVPPGGAELAGHWFAAGTEVCAQAFSMHRDPVIFPQPDEFQPSRWASPTKAMREAYMPFGRGARVCIGKHLALIELRLAAARFFLTFPEARMSSLEGMCDGDMKPMVHLLLSPSGGRCLIQA